MTQREYLVSGELRHKLGQLRLEEGGDADAYISQHHLLVGRIKEIEGSGAIDAPNQLRIFLSGCPLSLLQWTTRSP